MQCDNITTTTRNLHYRKRTSKPHLFKFRFTQFWKTNQPGDPIHCPYTMEADFWCFKTNPNKMKKGINQKMLCWTHNILIIISFSHFAFDIFFSFKFLLCQPIMNCTIPEGQRPASNGWHPCCYAGKGHNVVKTRPVQCNDNKRILKRKTNQWKSNRIN